jgi:hypothetical protein
MFGTREEGYRASPSLEGGGASRRGSDTVTG